MKRISACALAFVLSIVPAFGTGTGGVFTAILDGSPMTCQIWPDQSDFHRFGNSRSVSIVSNRCEGVEAQISLSFEQTGESISALEIRLDGVDGGLALFANTDTGATLEIISASEDGGFLSLSGNVSAQIGSSDDRGRTIDLSAARELEISFSGVIEGLGD